MGSKIDVSLFSSAIHREITFQVKLVVSMVTELALGLLSLSLSLSLLPLLPVLSPFLCLPLALSRDRPITLSFFLSPRSGPPYCVFFLRFSRSVGRVR